MSKPPDRIYVRGDVSRIEVFRAFRTWFELHAAQRGEKLDPAWYRDGPEEMPQLYGEAPNQQTIDPSSPDGGNP